MKTIGKPYTLEDAHTALVAWGEFCVRIETGVQGFARESSGLGDAKERPATALGPTDLAPAEFTAINEVVSHFDSQVRLIVECYYQPGRLQFSGLNGYGRQKGVSERNVAEALSMLLYHVKRALRFAREAVARRLTELG